VRGITTKDPLWWRIVRKGSSLEVLYSVDSKNFISTRLGYLPLQAAVDTGIMCCSPEGTGFECTFDEIRLAVIHATSAPRSAAVASAESVDTSKSREYLSLCARSAVAPTRFGAHFRSH